MHAQAAPTGHRLDDLPAVVGDPHPQHVVAGHEPLDGDPQPVRRHFGAVELGVEVSRDATERLTGAPADPVGVLHKREGELGVLVRLLVRLLGRHRAGGRRAGPDMGGADTGGQQCEPAVDRRVLRKLAEAHLDTGAPPLAHRPHERDGFQSELEQVRLVADLGRIFFEELRNGQA